MPKSARDRKEVVRERSRQAALDASNRSKRASRVTKYTVRGEKKGDYGQKVARVTVEMRQPKGMSLEAHWMELRPANVPVLDWFRLFTPNTDEWESLVEEAEYEFARSNDG